MITIILVLIVFLIYIYIIRLREGLNNQYDPISVKNDKLDEVFKRISTIDDKFYDPKYSEYLYEDIKMDMQYFNNTSALLWKLGQKIPAEAKGPELKVEPRKILETGKVNESLKVEPRKVIRRIRY